MTETAMETPGQPTGARNSGAAIGAEPGGGSSLAELVYHNAGSIVGCHLVAQPALHLGIALEHGGAVGSAREYALQMGGDAFEGEAVGKQLGHHLAVGDEIDQTDEAHMDDVVERKADEPWHRRLVAHHLRHAKECRLEVAVPLVTSADTAWESSG